MMLYDGGDNNALSHENYGTPEDFSKEEVKSEI